MSVQAGIWNYDGAPADRGHLTSISAQLAEYGPDGELICTDSGIGMLYRPFHTTPESRLEVQPYRFAGEKLITWDGRLDNRDDLIVKIGTALNSRSTDIAIVAGAYEKWGQGCFRKLVGDWAAVIWDPKER